MSEFHVFGASLAAINTIRILLSAGHKVHWHKMNERPLGHFGGITIDNELIDFGMVFLEYGSHKTKNSETSRFPEAQRALNEFFPDMDIRPAVIKSLHDGVLTEDIIIADNLELIEDQTFSIGTINHHPKEKWADEYFEQNSYEKVCSALFPKFYDKFLRRFAEKITSLQQAELSSRYHRAAWLPLYYPETVGAAARAAARSFPPYPFHRPAKGSIASHMLNLLRDVETNPACIIHEVPSNFSLEEQLEEISNVPHEQIFLCCKPDKLISKWNQELDEFLLFQHLNIGFFSVDRKPPYNIDCINDLDHPFVFRLFIQNDSSFSETAIVSVEFSGKWKDVGEANTAIHEYLDNLGIFSAIKSIKMMIGITGPAFPKVGAERKLSELAFQLNQKYEGYVIHGLSNGFEHTSMNAQITAASEMEKKL